MTTSAHPLRRRARRTAAVTVVLVLLTGGIAAATSAVFTVGPKADGTGLTPVGYTVTPVGLQTDLDNLPFGSALSPDGRLMLVSNDGQGQQSLQVVDTATSRVLQTLAYDSPEALYQGVAFSPGGKYAYASAGGNNKIRRYTVAGQRLTEMAPIALPTTGPDGSALNMYPAGLAVSKDGRTGYVADQLADAVSVLDLQAPPTATTSATSPAGVLDTVAVGHNPLEVALSEDGTTLWVSDQGESSVDALDVTDPGNPLLVRRVQVDSHPNALLLRGDRLYVANGDADTVSVIDATQGYVLRTLSLAPYKGAPVGSNPNDLALSRDGKTLYVAQAGANSVDVIDLGAAPDATGGVVAGKAPASAATRPVPLAVDARRARRADAAAAQRGPAVASTFRPKLLRQTAAPQGARIKGMIPVAWYPSSLQLTPDGRRLLVTNAKGLGAGPNDGPGYPDPTSASPTAMSEYSGSMIVGTLSTVPVPRSGQLARYTQQVVRNDGFAQGGKPRGTPAGRNPLPKRVGGKSPIKHVIYVVKENRTFDQVLGSLGRGNGDPSLNLFGDESAPNQRLLAKQFVTLDNFYADAEVSADGWNWSTAANANRYVQGTWPANYSGRNHPYEFEGGNLATAPNADPRDAYIWDRLDNAGIDYRNYGFFTFGADNTTAPTEPNLVAHTDSAFHGYDLNCPDHPGSFAPLTETCGSPRYSEWKKEFDSYQADGDLPAMQFVRLPSDHTSGTRAGYPTPQAYVADNDWAVGDLVDTVSHSRFWSSTAVFVVEDDAQNGPDHVDAHRTTAQVISPYTMRGTVDSTQYSTASMLRTMELIVGIGPLTQFDAFATPMYSSFSGRRDFTPYSSVKPKYDMTTKNKTTAPLAAASARQQLREADRINEGLFNEAIWKSVRGAGSPMPPPVHSLRQRGTVVDTDG